MLHVNIILSFVYNLSILFQTYTFHWVISYSNGYMLTELIMAICKEILDLTLSKWANSCFSCRKCNMIKLVRKLLQLLCHILLHHQRYASLKNSHIFKTFGLPFDVWPHLRNNVQDRKPVKIFDHASFSKQVTWKWC